MIIRGKLEIIVKGKGYQRVAHAENLITTNGLMRFAKAIAEGSDIGIDGMEAGTGTTAAAESDYIIETSVGVADSVTIQHLSGADNNKILYTGIWGVGDVVASVSEAGLLAGSLLINRSVFTPVSVSSSEILVINWTLDFNNP